MCHSRAFGMAYGLMVHVTCITVSRFAGFFGSSMFSLRLVYARLCGKYYDATSIRPYTCRDRVFFENSMLCRHSAINERHFFHHGCFARLMILVTFM